MEANAQRCFVKRKVSMHGMTCRYGTKTKRGKGKALIFQMLMFGLLEIVRNTVSRLCERARFVRVSVAKSDFKMLYFRG